jgi:hypothetical protein
MCSGEGRGGGRRSAEGVGEGAGAVGGGEEAGVVGREGKGRCSGEVGSSFDASLPTYNRDLTNKITY